MITNSSLITVQNGSAMKQEIKQFGKTILSSDYIGPGGLELFFANMTGKKKCGWEYWAFVENWVLQQGFELGPVELWEDGHLLKCGEISLPGKEVHHG